MSEENRAFAALELLRHKAMERINNGYCPYIDEEDLNEAFVVGGLPLIPVVDEDDDDVMMDIMSNPIDPIEYVEDEF